MQSRWLQPCCEWDSCPNHRRVRPPFLLPSGRLLLNGRWHCSLECFERAADAAIREMMSLPASRRRRPHRVPLGLVVLQRGQISEDGLKRALLAQREARAGRIGEWLRRVEGLTEEQVTQALGAQWACPVFPLRRSEHFLEAADLVPLPIQDSLRMLPVHFVETSRSLFVAFPEAVDYGTLNALEKALDCRAHPCLAEESAFEEALERVRSRPRPGETCFDSLRDPGEMARAARNHARSLGAQEARLVRCGEFLWMRLCGGGGQYHLVFKIADWRLEDHASKVGLPGARIPTQ